MLDKIRNSTDSKLAKVILAIIIIPFALFGIDSYLSSVGSNVYIAKVNGVDISAQQYQNTEAMIREQMTDPNTDPDLFDSPEFKKAVLDNLISTELMNQSIDKNGFVISNEQLSSYIVGMPDFQENGKFSQERYDQIVQYNNLTPKKLEDRIRTQMATQQAKDSIYRLIYVPNEITQPLVNLAYQKRDISLHEIRLDDYKKKIKPTDDEVKQFYDENTSNFIMPDRVKIEFLIYSVAGIVPTISVSNEEARQFFDANKGKFEANQQRRAKHILFAYQPGIDFEEKARIRDLAQTTLNEIKKSPKIFEKKVKELSQDTESAKQGGDLGFFSRDDMVKPFADAVFGLKVDGLSELVETEFGLHIIKLTDIKGEQVSFDKIKTQIKGELLYGKALDQYATNAENFNNTVYENSEDLSVAAQKFGLEVQQSQWLSLDDAKRFFNNDAFANEIFSSESIESKTNTLAIEVSPNNLVSARVIDFSPSALQPLNDIKEQVVDLIIERKSQELIIEDGNMLVEDLKSKKKKVEWFDELVIDRIDKQGLSDQLVKKIFQIDTSELPAYSGFYDLKGEFFVIKINNVVDEDITDELSVDLYREEYEKALKGAIQAAYIDDLRADAKIKINPKVLSSNQ
ncbi:SurA N-terminal domain-containing protein [Methylophilaceae bacterium]|nr:SurA N-terminal domain-containing protein [Methylophilaceae bacterium]